MYLMILGPNQERETACGLYFRIGVNVLLLVEVALKLYKECVSHLLEVVLLAKEMLS